MTLGRPITRKGVVTINPVASGPAANPVVLGGTVWTLGAPVDVVLVAGADRSTPPDVNANWQPVAYSDPNGVWGFNASAAAGTWVAWVRKRNYTRVAASSNPFTLA